MKQPKSGLLTDVTSRYLAGPNLPVKPLSDAQRLQVAAELMTLTVTELEAANALQASGSKYRIPDDVSPYQVAELILHLRTERAGHPAAGQNLRPQLHQERSR